MPPTAVVIDQREPEWVRNLTFGNAPTTVSLLEYGDLYVMTDDNALLIVERKTVEDLLGSLRDERIWQQLVGIRSQTQWAYLVVCGVLRCTDNGKVLTTRGETGWNWNAVQGALLQAQEMGVFVVQAASDEDYEAAVLRLVARSRKAEMVLEPVKQPRILSGGETVLASLPGIGPEKINALLQYAGSPAWALSYLTAEQSAQNVAGIGPIIRMNIRKALGLQPGSELSVVCMEAKLQ